MVHKTGLMSKLVARLKASGEYFASQPTILGLVLFIGLAILFAFKAPLRATLPALCLISGGVFVVGGTGKRTIEAERFILRDEQGKMRALLGMSATGPSLSFYDQEVRKKIDLGLRRGEPRIVFFNLKGDPMSWFYSTHASSGLVLAGKGASRGVEIFTGNGGSTVAVCDERGTERARVEYHDKAPSIHLRDAKGKVRAALQLVDSEPLFALFDGSNQQHGGWTVTPDGSTLGLYDSTGKIRVALVVNAQGPSMTVLDSEEKVTFSA